jgi:hypothetical protein
MARKPLPERFHKGPWSIGPAEVEAQTEHVTLIGRIMTLWPDVLHQMALLLGVLLGAKSEAAIAVFATLRNARARQDALIASGEINLDAECLELCQAVMSIVRAAEKERDHLAHGCFGICPGVNDGVLWIESKHIGPWNVSMLMKEPKFTGTEHAELAKYIFVYTKQDLEDIYRQIFDAWRFAFEFVAFVRWIQNPALRAGVRRGELYRQLCSSPPIQLALAQIRKGKKNS